MMVMCHSSYDAQCQSWTFHFQMCFLWYFSAVSCWDRHSREIQCHRRYCHQSLGHKRQYSKVFLWILHRQNPWKFSRQFHCRCSDRKLNPVYMTTDEWLCLCLTAATLCFIIMSDHFQATDPDSGLWGEVKYSIFGSGADLWVKLILMTMVWNK